MRRSGFTLIELLIAVTIVTILSVIGLTAYQGTQSTARDSVRKNDLRALATALELYNQKYGDYVVSQNQTCNDTDTQTFYTAITPYISGNVVPKDPKTSTSYCYFSANKGSSFRLFAKLENCSDPANPLCQYTNYNYSVVSDDLQIAAAPGDKITAPASTSTSTPCPTTAPKNLQPVNNQIFSCVTSVTLTWTAIANAGSYDVSVNDGGATLTTKGWDAVKNCTATQCTKQITVDAGRIYSWWVSTATPSCSQLQSTPTNFTNEACVGTSSEDSGSSGN